MLQKPVNNRRTERVANLMQEYQIAEMKHIGGKSHSITYLDLIIILSSMFRMVLKVNIQCRPRLLDLELSILYL